jgi:hypothetical protein
MQQDDRCSGLKRHVGGDRFAASGVTLIRVSRAAFVRRAMAKEVIYLAVAAVTAPSECSTQRGEG